MFVHKLYGELLSIKLHCVAQNALKEKRKERKKHKKILKNKKYERNNKKSHR